MAYVPGFEHDVFVSYAHIDNVPFGEGGSRWVSEFHGGLQKRLPMVLGGEVAVWGDPRLGGNEVPWEALELALARCAVLVLVLSPRYVESESCSRELACFERAVAAGREFQLGSRRRIFKVEKTPVPRARHPEAVRELLGFEFHVRDPETGESRELLLHPDPRVRFLYWPKLDDLVHDVAELLGQMKEQVAPVPVPPPPPRTRVYLASTTQDVRDDRERLERELKDHQCEVLPDRLLPDSAPELQASVRAALAECQLSIHLIGGRYGAIPEGESRSVIVLQHELASERANQGAFSQIIWMRPHVEAREAAQRDFIEQLERHGGARDGFEFMKSDIEVLKTVVLDRLAPRQGLHWRSDVWKDASPPPPTGDLYLICDRRDREAVEPLRRRLFEAGFEVTLPLPAGEAADVRAFHEDNLRLCDVALVYYGRAEPTWLQMKQLELRKAPGLGRSKPLVAWVYLAPPRTADKESFASRQVQILDGLAELPRARIASLAEGVRRARGSGA